MVSLSVLARRRPVKHKSKRVDVEIIVDDVMVQQIPT